MKKELNHKLIMDFPMIFMSPRMARLEDWNFECGDGWYEIIRDLCTEIMEHCKTQVVQVPVAVQVKEKFGKLRFYIDQGDNTIYDIIDKYEKHSSEVCEVCGVLGKTVSVKGWLKTVCEKHYEV